MRRCASPGTDPPGGPLVDSALWESDNARSLKDPLSFRNLPQVAGASRDALAHTDTVLAIEMNALQSSPIVVAAEDRLVSVANFEVSTELASTSHAGGIEDRATNAPLGARRLAEQVDLGVRLAAIELIVTAQAADRRGRRSGRGAAAARAAIRDVYPSLGTGRVGDVEPVVDLVRGGAFGEAPLGIRIAAPEDGAPDPPRTGDVR